jgi:hypothetical protein
MRRFTGRRATVMHDAEWSCDSAYFNTGKLIRTAYAAGLKSDAPSTTSTTRPIASAAVGMQSAHNPLPSVGYPQAGERLLCGGQTRMSNDRHSRPTAQRDSLPASTVMGGKHVGPYFHPLFPPQEVPPWIAWKIASTGVGIARRLWDQREQTDTETGFQNRTTPGFRYGHPASRRGGRDRQTWFKTGDQATAGRTPHRTEDRCGHNTEQAPPPADSRWQVRQFRPTEAHTSRRTGPPENTRLPWPNTVRAAPKQNSLLLAKQERFRSWCAGRMSRWAR